MKRIPIDDRLAVAGQPSQPEIAILAAPGRVVAHGRSGTRSLMLWAIGAVLAGTFPCADLLDSGAERGLDLSGAAHWLDAHGGPA